MSEDSTAFEDAIWRSTRFWRRHAAAGGEGRPRRVLVDLLVDHPVYYLGNLVLAKYLELTRGLKPLALVSSAGDRKIVLLARSFGIDDVVFVRDEVTQRARPGTGAILKSFEGLADGPLRRRVLGLGLNGIPVGDLLYDTYVRETRQVTLRRVDDDLKAYTALMLNYLGLYESILEREDVAATVMGHLVYLRFGMLARLAALRGADAYVRYGGKGMRVQRRRGVAAARDVMTRVGPDLVEGVLARDGEAAIAAGRETLARRLRGTGNEFAFLDEEGYAPTRDMVAADALCRRMGLDPARPKALLMLHAFPDANHFSPGLLFDDFYDWYRKTLGIVRDLPGTDWLVKLHPHLDHYTDDREPYRLAADAAAASPHVHVVPEGLNTASFPDLVDVLVTVNGKAGLEFAGLGVPVVLAGRGFYAGLGFTAEPRSVDDYAATLAGAAGLTLDTAQRGRALVANDLFFRRLICDCRFLPDTPYTFWLPFDEGAFWRGYASALESGGVADDTLFQAFGRMLSDDADTMLRPG